MARRRYPNAIDTFRKCMETRYSDLILFCNTILLFFKCKFTSEWIVKHKYFNNYLSILDTSKILFFPRAVVVWPNRGRGTLPKLSNFSNYILLYSVAANNGFHSNASPHGCLHQSFSHL